MAAVYRLSPLRRGLNAIVRLLPITRPFFDAGPAEPLPVFAAESARHPVFRIIEGRTSREVTRSTPGRSA